MGKLFVLCGKSASGKDTVLQRLRMDCPHLKRFVSYTTRPMRDGEQDGREYRFVTKEFFAENEKKGTVIEERAYNTVVGEWIYGTVDEGLVDFSKGSYIAIKDPVGACKLKQYYGEKNVVTILIDVNDGIRLMRAITREMGQENPKYAELCRRYLADAEDFHDFVADFTVMNDDVIKATENVKTIIRENRK